LESEFPGLRCDAECLSRTGKQVAVNAYVNFATFEESVPVDAHFCAKPIITNGKATRTVGYESGTIHLLLK
jgi:hypothetical protein